MNYYFDDYSDVMINANGFNPTDIKVDKNNHMKLFSFTMLDMKH